MRRSDGNNKRGACFLVGIALLMLAAAPAGAKVQLSVDVGWDNRFRPGKWTPLYVTLTDTSPRQVDLELYAPTDRRYAMVVHQGLSIGPTPVTVALYAPLSYQVDETSLTVRDADSGRRLEHLILGDFPAYRRNGTGPTPVEAGNLFIGISGSVSGERLLQTQFSQPNITTAYLTPMRLPAVPSGYEGIDLLVLNQPDLSRLSAEQQQAIADWVRGGGLLVTWPGTEAVPVSGPIVEILPAQVGENRSLAIPLQVVRDAGLPDRFAKLKGRALLNPDQQAAPVRMFAGSDIVGFRRWVGMGQVLMLPIDASQLQFHGGGQSIAFWRKLLDGVVPIPQASDPGSQPGYYYGSTEDPRRAAALRQTLDWIGDIPGAGQFGFWYVAMVLIAMMVIVGPVDWFVLKWLGKQPWTWVTISGWIGLVTIGSIYLGHIFKSGEVHFRTTTLVDEAGGWRVASHDLVGIYSPRTTRYTVELTPESFWRPTSGGSMYGGTNLRTEIPCHQDYRGSRPLPLLINVWNLRFLEGVELTPAAPIVQAHLTRAAHGGIGGSITNRAAFALRNIRVRTRDGVMPVDGVIEPGATMQLTPRSLSRDDTSLSPTTMASDADRWQMYHGDLPATQPSARTLNGVGDLRSVRIDQQLRDRADVACIYAEYAAEPAHVKLKVEQARRGHAGAVRAMVPLE